VASAQAPSPVASAEAPGPSAKELEIEKAWAKIESDNQTELSRWTPELRATAKRLAETSYPSTDAALRSLLASNHRKPGNSERDKYRHPRESLEFFGLQPTWTTLEFGPGAGWYTELLAPLLAKRGKLLVTTEDPNGPRGENATQSAARLKLLLQSSPELYSKVEPVRIDGKNPKLELQGTLDAVLVIRMLHGFVNNGTLDGWLAEFKHALKPKGVLAVIEHRAPAGADPAVSAKKGYVPEAWAIERIEAAGYKLVAKSEINANPKDTKDYPEGVWSLPPTYREGDKDRAKYAAIGESDRFTLRFVKK
jgi:predicted methyltransferase